MVAFNSADFSCLRIPRWNSFETRDNPRDIPFEWIAAHSNTKDILKDITAKRFGILGENR